MKIKEAVAKALQFPEIDQFAFCDRGMIWDAGSVTGEQIAEYWGRHITEACEAVRHGSCCAAVHLSLGEYMQEVMTSQSDGRKVLASQISFVIQAPGRSFTAMNMVGQSPSNTELAMAHNWTQTGR